MCLQRAAFSRLDNIDSMESIQSENDRDDSHPLKDCRVVLVPLQDDIVRRKTITLRTIGDFVFASRESSNLDLLIFDNHLEETEASLPISLYSKIENGIITEVRCKTFRKKKCHFQLEMEADDEVTDVMKCILDRVSAESNSTHTIDFASPGDKEMELITDFCRENGYEPCDYRDLKQLFTFRTLPVVEVTKLHKPGSKRRRAQSKKFFYKKTETFGEQTNEAAEAEKYTPPGDFINCGLEKIENLKIRKILEDFGRLSKSEENTQAPKQKKMRPDSSCILSKNTSSNKPLNLCKKDNQDNEKPIKISKSVQADISISGSILRTLLHNQECVDNPKKDQWRETGEKNAQRQASTENNPKKTTKKSTAQQTDFDLFGEEKTLEKDERESNGRNDKWLNDPTAILKKIQKLKKDILYLDLLAEEKEKERIAILCFKNYKESILKKIFANDMSEEASDVSDAQNNVINSSAMTIPKLIHPTNTSATTLMEQRSLNSAHLLFPSSVSLLERQNSCSTLSDNPSIGIDPINENFIRLGNCIKCDLLKGNFLNSKYRNPWYCNPLCQTHSCSQHAKECRGFAEEASSSK